MKTLFNFGELGNFDFQTEDNVKYIASFLGWKEFTEKTVQVKLPAETVKDEDGNPVLDEEGNEQTFIPTYPEIQQVANEISADTYIITKAKELLANIPKQAYMQRNQEKLDAMKKQMEDELSKQIESSIN